MTFTNEYHGAILAVEEYKRTLSAQAFLNC